MKILKKGPSEWAPQMDCDACDSILELEQSDLLYKFESNGPKIENDIEEFWVECGVCQNKIPIHETKIPKLVKMEIKNKYFKRG